MLSLVSPVAEVRRRDLDLNDTDLINPNDSEALEQGEWLVRNSSTGRLERAAGGTVPGMLQMWTQRGDTSAQAIGKVSVLQLHEYEAETDMFDPNQDYAAEEPLTVAAVEIDGVTRAVLTNQVTADQDYVIGYVTQSDDDNPNSLLRFQKVPAHMAAG